MYVKLKVFFEHLGKFLCLMELSSEMRQRTPPPPFQPLRWLHNTVLFCGYWYKL
jgi:hypothetical protein